MLCRIDIAPSPLITLRIPPHSAVLSPSDVLLRYYLEEHNLNMHLSLGFILGLASLATAAFSTTARERDIVTHRPTRPPSYPLAVRNPYLSTWMPSDQVQTLPYAEPQFWAGQSLTWSIMARVDGQTYSLMSITNPSDKIRPAIVRTAEYTATHSVFTLSAGPVIFTLDFFSPVSPSNYLRQSLPFSMTRFGPCGSLRRANVYPRLSNCECIRGQFK